MSPYSWGSANISPVKKAALAISSTTVGPDGRARFSIRKCATPFGNSVTGAVPAPHRAVVHSERRKLRNPSARQYLEWIFIRLGNHDRSEARDLIMEQRNHRMLKPALSEADSGWLASGLLRSRTCVGRVLKQGDSRLLPQSMTKQERRVDCHSEHRSSYRLGNVVVIDEFTGTGLKVNLKTCIARLHHDVVVRQV